jgi:hypothetical protein
VTRSLTASVQTELAKDKIRLFGLLELHFDSGSLYLARGYRPITWGGQTYQPDAGLIDVSAVEETTELRVGSITITLEGVSQAHISSALSEDYIDRQVKVYRGLLDASGDVIPDPFLLFDGRISGGPVIEEDPDRGDSTVRWTAASHWADFQKVAGRRTSHADQQVYFPGDLGFEYAAMDLSDLKWGRP